MAIQRNSGTESCFFAVIPDPKHAHSSLSRYVALGESNLLIWNDPAGKIEATVQDGKAEGPWRVNLTLLGQSAPLYIKLLVSQ